jgi:hypothetical protein
MSLTSSSCTRSPRTQSPSSAPYHLVSDVSFPSLQALQACAGSKGGKEALAHAASISTGGPPVVMIVTDLVTN